MNYYSTNQQIKGVSLKDAVVKGLADDKGLFMPDVIKQLPASFFENIENLSFQEIAYTVNQRIVIYYVGNFCCSHRQLFS